MQRTEKIGLGIAVAGHILVFALLSVGFHPPVDPDLYKPKPIDVSLAEDVALQSQAPKAIEPPAQSKAPDPGPPEDAAPPEPQPEAKPEPEKAPAPPKPAPEPAPAPKPKPAPKPEPAPVPKPKPVPKPVKVPPKPEKPPVEAKESKAAPKKATAKPDTKAEAKRSPAKPTTAKAAPSHAAAAPAKAQTPPSRAKGTGSDAKSTLKRPRGSLLDDDFRKGLTMSPSTAKPSAAAPGATMNAKAAADIGSAIQRQVQPCAEQQSLTGPGVSRIVVKVHLRLNRDGSLAVPPTIDDDHGGVDDENRRYVDAVDRAAIAAFKGCSPLRGLPLDLYDVPHGWKSFTLRFKLPG